MDLSFGESGGLATAEPNSFLAGIRDESDFGYTRNYFTAYISYYEGRNFPHSATITREMASYSAMVRLADGTVDALVKTAGENDVPYGDGTFIRFSLSELENPFRRTS